MMVDGFQPEILRQIDQPDCRIHWIILQKFPGFTMTNAKE